MKKSNRVTIFIAPTGDEWRAWMQGPKKKKPKNPDRYRSWEQDRTQVNVLKKMKTTVECEHLHIDKVIYLKEAAEDVLKRIGR